MKLKWRKPLYLVWGSVIFLLFLYLLYQNSIDWVEHIAILPTMLLGSFVAGSTPMGGGSVAYPILVHYLDFGATDARTFSLLIQSVGMTSASLYIILYKKEELPWRFISRVALAGLSGFLINIWVLYDLIAGALLKVIYIPFFLSFLIILLYIQFGNGRQPDFIGPEDSRKSYLPALIAGFCGGILTGFIGSGIDFMVFTVLALYFGFPIKKGTYISILLMTFLSICNSLLLLGDTTAISDRVWASWLLAANLVLFGAPLGNLVMRMVPDTWVTAFITLLFGGHVLGVFQSTPLTSTTYAIMLGCFLGSFYFFYRIYRTYTPPSPRHKPTPSRIKRVLHRIRREHLFG
ncbi:MAG: sulfite exporter TauE/SafE family protein [Bacteroidota bacterium]